MSFRYANPQQSTQTSSSTSSNPYSSIPRPADPPTQQQQQHNPSSPASSLAYSQYAYSTTSGPVHTTPGNGANGFGSGSGSGARPRLQDMAHGRSGSAVGAGSYQQPPQTSSSSGVGAAAAGRSFSNSSIATRRPSREELRPPLPRPSGSASGTSSSGRGQPGGRGNEQVARVHYQALRRFLSTWLTNESPTARASAREKLTRLTRSQFQELSTDVYDELVRRLEAEREEVDGRSSQDAQALPFLPVRQDFHPKRNQARQKLATLPKNRFKDLASDVFFELRRRFPEFDAEWDRENGQSNDRAPDRSAPPPSFPSSLPRSMPDQLQPAASIYRDRDKDGDRDRDRDRNPNSSSERLVPGPARQPSRSGPPPNLAHSTSQAALTTTATNEVVVPNKSTIAEEQMEVPYAKFSTDADDTSGDEEDGQNVRNHGRGSQEDLISPTRESRHDRRPLEVKNRTSTASAASSRRRDASISSNHPYNTSNPLNLGASINSTLANTDDDHSRERKVKAELEGKVASLERRLAGLEKELEDTGRREKWERDRTKELEDEVRGSKEHSRHHAEELRSMQREIDAARDQLGSERMRTDGKRREDQVEAAKWKERYQGAADEATLLRKELSTRSAANGGDHGAEVAKELQNELIILMDELKSLSIRNEEMMAEKDADLATIHELDDEVRMYKRKWEEARTDLRNLKATSMMFVAKPMTEDHLPASPDGHVADIHVTAFQSAIDSLLGAARSSTPTGVLPAMKAVVEAISNISEDVREYERRPNFPIDSSALEVVKHQSTTTLNALMQAARNHAMASGLSPLSLMDAAAGHVSANVIEIIKLLKIRKTAKSPGSKASLTKLSIDDMRRRSSAGGVETLRDPASPISPGGLGMPRQETYGSPLRTNSFSVASGEQHSAPMGRSGSSGSFSGLGGPSAPIMRSGSGQSGHNMSFGAASGRSPSALLPSPMNGYSGAANHVNNGMTVRTNRTDSVVSVQSDAFDLDRKASVVGSRGPDGGASPALPSTASFGPNGLTVSPALDASSSREHNQMPPLPAPHSSPGRSDLSSSATGGNVPITPAETRPHGAEPGIRLASDHDGGADDRPNGIKNAQWEELKPYLSTQSSALVNAIQKLLAEIRNGGIKPNASTNLLQDHLSEVIAIGSSIIAVSANAIPNAPDAETGAVGGEGEKLLNELVSCTDRLSEYQSRREFSKPVRQEIASAAFGMAKSLRALMKVST